MSEHLSSKQRNKLQHSLNGNMGAWGNLLGQGLGRLGGGFFGQGDLGQNLGGSLGNLLPFKRGGKKQPAKKRGGTVMPVKKKGGKTMRNKK
jgi:hypothetical protein